MASPPSPEEFTNVGREFWFEVLVGVRMKEWVEPDIRARLMEAFAHFDTPESWRALDVTAGLFPDLAQATAERLGHGYPQDVDERVNEHMRFLRGR